MKEFSHLDNQGNPAMVDISAKAVTSRIAIAQSLVIITDEIYQAFTGDDIMTKKGPVFQTANLAGIMAVKKTSELIPLCHPLSISKCKLDISMDAENTIKILCTVKTDGKTGVEMEALTGASIAALTIYDMCKAFSHDIRITDTQLIEKKGGKSDFERQ